MRKERTPYRSHFGKVLYDSLNDDLLMVYYFTVYDPGLEESSIQNSGRDLSI